jgi:hypothetical protein
MWTEKFSGQVLRVLTPLGPRYIKPSSTERLYLLWMFRHFPSLPERVLSPRQKKLIDRLCSKSDFALVQDAKRLKEIPIIGTVERPSKFQTYL